MLSRIETPTGILSFPVLFTPKPRAPGQEAVFSISLLFDENAQRMPAFKALKAGAAAAIEEKWPGKKNDKAFLAKLRSPFRPSEEKAYSGYDIENGIYISPWSRQRPEVIDARLQDVTLPTDVWAGQLVRATVVPFAYQNTGNMGVSFLLNALQICRTDTPRIDGRVPARKQFGVYEDADSIDVDAALGLDDRGAL
jgi:hypothetical protein